MLSGIVQGTGDAVALVLLFGFTIFLHELGHFLLARRLGLVVETFSIGFGPALWKRKIRGVTYKIGLIPVGGYVALPQLDPSGMAVIQGPSEEGGAVSRRREKQSWWAVFFGRQVHDKVASEGRESTLPPVAPWKKIVVSISGAAGNCLLALGMAWGIYLAPEAASTGVPGEGAIVGHVDTNSVAYSRGIRMGDKILAVNGRQVRSWYEFNVESLLGSGRSNVVNLTLLSLDGAEKRVSVPTVPNERGMYAVEGVHKAIPCILGRVTKGGSAEAAGARPGDRVVEFDGVRVTGWEHFRSLVEKTGEREVVMVVERKGKRISLTVTPRYDEKFGRPMI
ncbi:MAG: site-2 protease family protein, partial [Kiritimatiellae bacterium]|nr:site-2 protease family protein [Kiritimatiellia bacterium]